MATELDMMLGPMPEDEGGEAAGAPVRKGTVNYRPAEEGMACEGCRFFREPESCRRVLGQISASAVCDLWEPADTEELIGGGLEEFLWSGPQGGPQGGGLI